MKFFRFNLELLQICCFFCLYQIVWAQWNMGYWTENTIKQIFYSLGFSCFCLHCNNNTKILHTYWECRLPLWILVCIVLTMTHGFIKDYCQMNHYWFMLNIIGATIHLIKHLALNSYSPFIVSSLLTLLHLYWIYKFYQW